MKRKKSEYKHVYFNGHSSQRYAPWIGHIIINEKLYRKSFLNERDAAIFVDVTLIKFGKEPVNILKRK